MPEAPKGEKHPADVVDAVGHGMGVVFFKVIFCFAVGAAIPMLMTSLADLVSGSHTDHILVGTMHGIAVLIVFGLFGVTLAIWDGQFINDIKPTHSRRHRNSN